MLFTKKQQVDERIVQILSEHHGIRTKELLAFIERRFGRTSDKSVYQEIAKLRSQGVVVISDKKIFLREDWIRNAEKFVKQALTVQLSYQAELINRLHEKGNVRLKATSLSQLGEIWSNTILLLIRDFKHLALYESVQYPWWILTNATVETALMREIRERRIFYWLIMTADSTLNREYQKLFHAKEGRIEFGKPIGGLNERYFSVIGDIVIRVKIPDSVTKLIANCFSSKKSIDINTLGEYSRLQNSRGQFVLDISLEPRTAKKVIYEFNRFFGVS